MWLFLMGLAFLAGDVIAQGQFVQYSSPQRPLRPIAPLYHTAPVRNVYYDRPVTVIRNRPRPAIVSNRFPDDDDRIYSSDNHCANRPCGPNTRCENMRNAARCHCLPGYVPRSNTIEGCGHQCTSDDDCSDDYKCSNNKCVLACAAGGCGLNAECKAIRHRATCECPRGFSGDPHIRCKIRFPEIRNPPLYDIDVCYNACGEGADCRERNGRPVCSCPTGAEGNPLDRCVKGECIEHDECPDHLACQALRCIDPCNIPSMCGRGSECSVRNHQPVCSCPRNYIGDPFRDCRIPTEADVCQSGTCAENTNCRARSDRNTGALRAVCSCIENYLGDPINRGCYAECITDSDCGPQAACRDNRCRNPCVDACGTDAYCDVQNSRAVCRCHKFYQGDPYNRCYPECTSHEECPSHQACFQFSCIDPCQDACGRQAICEVEDHQAICKCPKTMTGNPFESCRLFTDADLCDPNPCGTNADCTPGHDRSQRKRPVCTCPRGFIGNPMIRCEKGECETHSQCPDHQACYAYECQNPCVYERGSVCGENANCRVKNHKPICSCPRGYDGDPISECRVAANARRPTGGGHKIAYEYEYTPYDN